MTSSLSPRIVALQESLLRPSDKPSFRGYEVLHRARVADRASGGVALLIAHDTSHEPVTLQTDLEILAIRVHTTPPLTVASVYLPPGQPFHRRSFLDILPQLPRPFVLLGDFNAHHPLWGSTTTCARGRQLEDILFSNRFSSFNTFTAALLTGEQHQPVLLNLWVNIGGFSICDMFLKDKKD